MSANTNVSQNSFSNRAKCGVEVNQEITENGLVWRKLSDGSGVWRYDFRVNGKRIKGVIGKERDGVTLSQARETLKKLRAKSFLERNKLEHVCEYADMYFEKAAEEYLAWARVNRSGFRQTSGRMKNQLLPYFKGLMVVDITSRDVSNFQTKLLQDGLSNRTVDLCVCLLSSVYRYLQQSDSSLDNPTRKVQKPRKEAGKIETVTDAEFEDLMMSCKGESKYEAIIGLAYYAGMRASEILGLEWNNVDFDNELITVCKVVVEGEIKETTKNGKYRVIPMSKDLMGILRKHKEDVVDESYVISNDSGSHYHHVQKMFYTLKSRMNKPFMGGIHVLRHTFATRAIKKGVNLPTLQSWMGHSDIKTTMGYVHITQLDSSKQMQLMN